MTTTRRRTVVAVVVVLALLGVGALVRSAARTSADATGMAAGVAVALPESITAGDTVEVAVMATTDGAATVVVASSAGVTARDIDIRDGRASFTVGSPITDAAGLLTVSLPGTDAPAARTAVLAGTAVGEIAPLLGPRSVVVDRERIMIVAVPRDALGNPVAAGTPVQLSVERPDGRVETAEIETDGMLAWRWVDPGRIAGSARASVVAGTARGPDVRFREVPDVPTTIAVTLERVAAQSDGTRTVRARTAELRDRFGNILLDGTSATFLLRGPDGVTAVSAIVAGGIARADLPITGAPGAREVVVHIGEVASEVTPLTASPATDDLPVTREPHDEDRDVLQIGPVVDVLGALLPDGTVAEIHGPDLALSVQMEQGRARVEIPRGAAVTVSVAGVEVPA